MEGSVRTDGREVPLNTLVEVTRDATALGSASSLLFMVTVTAVSIAATFSRDPRRRTDARRALEILLRRNTADREDH